MLAVAHLWLLAAVTQHPIPTSVPRSPSKGVARAQQPKLASYVNSPLDPDTFVLPPGYRGASIEALIAATKRQARGEFETSEQYQERISQPGFAGTYGFVLEGTLVYFEYNADQEAFEGTVFPDHGVFIGYEADYSSRALVVSEKVVSNETYVGSNAFGANVTVHKRILDVFALLPAHSESSGLGTRSITLRVRVPLKDAPAVKRALRVLVVASLSGEANSVQTGFYHFKPTITEPRDWIKNYNYLRARLLSVWVFNATTGTIYTRVTQ